MKQRNEALDALRGFAILAMVLSSSIAFGILPAWMYHAQVPPPWHQYQPQLPGITWVDLVFPFFLFSMGAAIPLAMSKKNDSGFLPVLYTAGRRFALLAFFAFFTLYMRAGMLTAKPDLTAYLLSIGAFVLLFFQFYEPAEDRLKKTFTAIKWMAFAIAAALLCFLPFKDGKGFSFNKTDIIILVLGNMAFFGTIAWWFTRKHVLARVILPAFIMAIFIGSREAGSWNETVFNWTPLPWLYKFYYLKYLFIIIPGTMAGDWLLQYKTVTTDIKNHLLKLVAVLSFILIVINVALLFSRDLVPNLFLSSILCLGIYLAVNKMGGPGWIKRFAEAGACLLLLGLCFDAYEGGIKKDPSTYSYYFVTSGLAFFMLLALYGLQHTKAGSYIVRYLSLNGRNPMVAYVTGNLLLLPLLWSTGVIVLFNSMEHNVWLGVLRGILFTGIVSLVTVFFTKKGWYWKT